MRACALLVAAAIGTSCPVFASGRQSATPDLTLGEVLPPAGCVSGARVRRSIPLLDSPAVAAVSGWVFTPTLLDGSPVPVIMTVTVNFTLQ